MSTSIETQNWTPSQIFLLRLVFIFFVILSIPYDLHLFHSLSGGFFSFENLFQLATYRTSFIPENLYAGIHLEGYFNWLIAFVLAVLGAFLWDKSKYGKAQADYDQLYYWLRVLLRYRLALAIIVTGIAKILPIQVPDPTISDLHTEYGDLLLWKLYYLTNGISTAGYLPLIGFLELLGGLFLLYRKTSVIGSGLLLSVLLNIVLVNYVYEIGEQVYSSFLFLLTFAVFFYDLPRFYGLLVAESGAKPDVFVPSYSSRAAKIRPYLQVVFLLFISFYTVQAYFTWKDTNYPYPKEKGIAGTSGIYDVKDFVVNGDTLAYSLTDSVRWQDVVFEEWNTLSIRENSPVKIDSLKPRISYTPDRNYEQLGNGGRHFYSYEYAKGDSTKKSTIKLTNKTNAARSYNLSYEKLNPNTILLKGVDWKGDSLSVTLERVKKKYLLKEGRRKPIKIY